MRLAPLLLRDFPAIFFLFCAVVFLQIPGAFAATQSDQPIRFQKPEALTFQELVALAANEVPAPAVENHLRRLLSKPFIDNGAAFSRRESGQPKIRRLGPALRIAEWNIRRGANEEQVELALTDPDRFNEIAHSQPSADKETLIRVAQQVRLLSSADIVILNEVDLGMKRTGYRDVARDLADKLHFNYVYGVEFVELERLYMGAKKLDTVDINRQRTVGETFGVDPALYRGLEGNAVLSRFPILDAKIVRLPNCYDWYHQEIDEISNLEQARRWSAGKIFEESIRRQVRRGGRMVILVDVAVPQSPTGRVTVVCTHLEDYSPPECRREQMDSVLNVLRDVGNPVVLGGDLNTSGHDGTPTSLKREILKRVTSYRFWIRKAIFWWNPIPVLTLLHSPLNYFKNYRDPTAANIRFILPNREKPLFNDVEDFRFADGGAFDFGGRKNNSFHHKGRTLSESNQRAWKGFVPTFSFKRTYFHLVGSYKLDWLFVKPTKVDSPQAPAAFSPSYGRTLREMNKALGTRISDHSPITVDLPFRADLRADARGRRR